MTRLVLTLLASFALFMTPLVTMCQHGGDGHVEILGRCHDDGSEDGAVPGHTTCGHGCGGHHHHAPGSRSAARLESPHLQHEKLVSTDLLRVEWRSGFDPSRSLAAAEEEGETELRFEGRPRETRGREPPRSPPLILLTEAFLL